MKSSCQTQLSGVSVKAAGVTLKLLLAPQTSFSFQEIKHSARIGSSALYQVLHELRTGDILSFTPSAPGIPASYHLLISFHDFQQPFSQHTYNTNNTNTTDKTDGTDHQEPPSDSGSSAPPQEPTPNPSQEGNFGSASQEENVGSFSQEENKKEVPEAPKVEEHPSQLSLLSASQSTIDNQQSSIQRFEVYGLSVPFVKWALAQRMQKFQESEPNYDLLQQHCQYAQQRLNVKFFANYVAANFLNPAFNYDTPLFWGLSGIAQESGYRKPTPNPSQEGNFGSSSQEGNFGSSSQEGNTAPCPQPNFSQSSILSSSQSTIDNQQSTIQGVWSRILTRLERGINRPSFNTWLRPTTLLEAGPEVWRIGVPDEVFVYWLGEYYRFVMREAIARETGCAPEVEFVVAEEFTTKDTKHTKKEA